MKPKLRFTHFTEDYIKSKLKNYAAIYDGTHETPNYVDNGIKFISVENIKDLLKTDKYISENDYKKYKIKPKYNDVFMTRIGDIGTPAIYKSNDQLAYYVSLALLRSKNESLLYPDYLKQYISNQRFQKELHDRTIHVAFPKKINTGEIGECNINIPSYNEQVKVSNFLSLLDKKIELQSKKIEDLKLFKICISDRFFNAKSKETKKMLSNHCILLTGKSKVNQFDENGIYYIMDMGTVNADGYILKNKPTFCDLDMLSYGDLIMPKDDIGGGLIIGKTGFIDENNKYILGDHVYLIKTKNINSLYLHYQINSKYINKELKRKVTGSAQLGLKADNILNQEILVHSENNQNKIANIFELIDKKIKLENQKIENLFELKKGLMQSMFI